MLQRSQLLQDELRRNFRGKKNALWTGEIREDFQVEMRLELRDGKDLEKHKRTDHSRIRASTAKQMSSSGWIAVSMNKERHFSMTEG